MIPIPSLVRLVRAWLRLFICIIAPGGAGVRWTPLRSRSTDRAGRRDMGGGTYGFLGYRLREPLESRWEGRGASGGRTLRADRSEAETGMVP